MECAALSRKLEEKQSEVSLATDLVRFACRNHYEVAILISADRDFVPCVKVVQRGEGKRVINIFPNPPAPPTHHSKYKLSSACQEDYDLQELGAIPRSETQVPIDLIRQFSQYQRQDDYPLTKDKFKKWVRQFGNGRQQELAEILLRNVDFYGRKRIENIMKDLVEEVLGSISSEDVGVAALGNIGDSSALITYISREMLKSFGLQTEALSNLVHKRNLKTVIFLDDNISSGKQANEIFLQWFGSPSSVLNERHVSSLSRDAQAWLRDRTLVLLTCVTYRQGKERLQQAMKELGLNLQACRGFKSLDARRGCFHPTNSVYTDEEDRREARELMQGIGYALLGRKSWSDEQRQENALGYGGSQGLSVFFHNTPTSTLPVLWSKGVVNDLPWYPVFERRERT